MDSLDTIKAAILERVSIYDVIGEVVPLQSRSGLKVGCCPFHDEKSPSFSVYPDHYFCFGCKEHGDIISFVRKTQGVGYVDALKFLAPRAGLNPADLDSTKDKQQRSQEAALFKALVAAQRYFVDNLRQPNGGRTVEYLRGRGFSDANIADYGFGRSFDEPRGLIEYLSRQGYHERVLESCSLATRSQKNNRLYDFFRDRLMVPIHDQFGRMIGFGGRALSDEQMPKYKNSRESQLFDKSVTLFGFHRAKEAIRKGDPAIICEGYMDVLQLWQNGLGGAVACMGTALKQAHLKKISNLTNKVFLVLDGDYAGQQGSLGAISAALDVPKLDVRVVSLPTGEDPDSFVRAHGPDALRELLQQAQALLDFGIKAKLARATDTSVPETLRQEILPWIMREQDHLRQAFLLNRIAQITGISRSHLESELELISLNHKHSRLAQTDEKKRDGALQEQPAQPRRKLTNLEYEFLGHVFYALPQDIDVPSLQQFVRAELSLEILWEDMLGEMFQFLNQGETPAGVDRSIWEAGTDPRALALIQHLDKQKSAFDVKDRARQIRRLQAEMSIGQHRATISKLKDKMRSATDDEQISILQAIQGINKSIKSIETALK